MQCLRQKLHVPFQFAKFRFIRLFTKSVQSQKFKFWREKLENKFLRVFGIRPKSHKVTDEITRQINHFYPEKFLCQELIILNNPHP